MDKDARIEALRAALEKAIREIGIWLGEIDDDAIRNAMDGIAEDAREAITKDDARALGMIHS